MLTSADLSKIPKGILSQNHLIKTPFCCGDGCTIFHGFPPIVSNLLTHRLISKFAVCTMLRRVYEDLYVTRWNYTYRHYEIAYNKLFCKKSRRRDLFLEKTTCCLILLSDH